MRHRRTPYRAIRLAPIDNRRRVIDGGRKGRSDDPVGVLLGVAEAKLSEFVEEQAAQVELPRRTGIDIGPDRAVVSIRT